MAVDGSKLLDRDIGISKGAHITASQVKGLKIVNVKLKDVSGNLKDNLVLSKTRAALKKRKDEERRRKAREKLLEKNKEKGSGGKLKVPGMGFIDSIINGLISILFGMIVVKALDWLKNPMVGKVIKWISVVGKVILDVAGWVLVGFTNLVDWGYKLYDNASEWIKNNVSEEAVEKFQTFMGNLKNLINGFIAWKLVGEKIFKSIVSKVTFIFKHLGNIIKAAFKAVKSIAQFAWKLLPKRARAGVRLARMGITRVGKRLGRRVGIRVGRLIGRGGRQLLSSTGKAGGSIMKHGLGRVAKRLSIKFLGKTATKIFGRIPIIGPLIVGIVSLMSGEPLGQALFKTFGAAIGGLLGTFIPIPVLGTILGEVVGAFVGDLLYHLIIKRDPKAAMKILGDTLKGIFNGGKAIVEWVGRGIQNFTDNFPTFDVPDVGLQDVYIGILDKVGLGGVIDWEIPNWMGIPDGLKGLSIRKVLDSLPRIPDILGLVTQFIPGLSSYTEDGKLKKLPAIWQLYNPMYMVPALIKSFFQGGGNTAASAGSPAKVTSSAPKDDASKVSESASYEEGGEGTETIIPVPIPRISTPSISQSPGGRTVFASTGGSGDPTSILYMR